MPLVKVRNLVYYYTFHADKHIIIIQTLIRQVRGVQNDTYTHFINMISINCN
jgi:hypothetical protein